MRLRNIRGARDRIAESPYVIDESLLTGMPGKWAEKFGNGDCPLCLEIGMGKGQFLTEMALRHPEINFIGIERYSSVLIRALDKREKLLEEGTELKNLLYLRMNAEYLSSVFGEREVSRIYLNFSDPWPKDRHEKRRLPGRTFLRRYQQVLCPEGLVEFKTDNRTLFDFAHAEAEAEGWPVLVLTYDLHHDALLSKGNIQTEYEEKFSSLGNPICKLVIQVPG